MASLKEIIWMVCTDFQYLPKEMEARFQNSWDPPSIGFCLHTPKAHNSIHEKGSYDQYFGRTATIATVF
jgi:hypothetical protein